MFACWLVYPVHGNGKW